jgi:uncharacterized membrane protein YgaE (UPF0421/DUF939 family)
MRLSRGIQLVGKRFVLPGNVFQYILKCIIGTSVCYDLYIRFPNYPFYWSMLSVALVFTVENKNELVYDRMKANFLGCIIGLILYFIPLNSLSLIIIGIGLVIYMGTILRLGNAIRTALAALIIVVVKQGIEKEWWIALSRMICVVVGCLVALVVTLGFFYYNKLIDRKKQNQIQ